MPTTTTTIPTRILILSDTHAASTTSSNWQPRPNLTSTSTPIDVLIHCGDPTEESKLSEFKTATQLLESIPAPLKLVIPGNHDFTLDESCFRRKVAEAVPPPEEGFVRREFGVLGGGEGVVVLGEGRHEFGVGDGGRLRVYASPWTPSMGGKGGGGFQFKPAAAGSGGNSGHTFDIGPNIDVAITHGPPLGIPDMTGAKQRGGCAELFAAVARARPRVHCFGHIHEGWGAKSVAWRGETAPDAPSHFRDIDHGRSEVLETLGSLRAGKWDAPEVVAEKAGEVGEV